MRCICRIHSAKNRTVHWLSCGFFFRFFFICWTFFFQIRFDNIIMWKTADRGFYFHVEEFVMKMFPFYFLFDSYNISVNSCDDQFIQAKFVSISNLRPPFPKLFGHLLYRTEYIQKIGNQNITFVSYKGGHFQVDFRVHTTLNTEHKHSRCCILLSNRYHKQEVYRFVHSFFLEKAWILNWLKKIEKAKNHFLFFCCSVRRIDGYIYFHETLFICLLKDC